MSVGIVQVTEDGQDTELKRINKIASGDIEGIFPAPIKADDIEKVKSAVDECRNKAKEETATSGDISKAAFAVATYRDLRYSVCGRKFARIAAMSGKSYAAWGRIHALDWMSSDE